VGGKGKLAMADLRAAAEACGYENVRSYIQSGNLVFVAPSATTRAAAERLREVIADTTQVRPDVIVRTRDELASVVEQNPYIRQGADTAHLHVVFASGEEDASLGSIDLAWYAPEEAAAVGRQLHLFLPTGMGRSKLAVDLARRTGPSGTTRNWRTVTKLLEMADDAARG